MKTFTFIHSWHNEVLLNIHANNYQEAKDLIFILTREYGLDPNKEDTSLWICNNEKEEIDDE